MTRSFICYHHENDQEYKNHLAWMAQYYGCFEDGSVGVGDIVDDDRDSQAIRRLIRDEYLGDTEVTILLCGTDTRHRKHVDWELKSSMIDGSENARSGILVIDLPTTTASSWHTAFDHEKATIYPDYTGSWVSVTTRAEYERRYPEMPARIIDQLMKSGVSISIVPWTKIENNPAKLSWLLEESARAGKTNEYDLSRKMRRGDYSARGVTSLLGRGY